MEADPFLRQEKQAAALHLTKLILLPEEKNLNSQGALLPRTACAAPYTCEALANHLGL